MVDTRDLPDFEGRNAGGFCHVDLDQTDRRSRDDWS
jgi:hypothetical protein